MHPCNTLRRAASLAALGLPALGLTSIHPAGADIPVPVADPSALDVQAQILCGYPGYAPDGVWQIDMTLAEGAAPLTVGVHVPGRPTAEYVLQPGPHQVLVGPVPDDELSEVEISYGNTKIFTQPGTPDCSAVDPIAIPIPKTSVSGECATDGTLTVLLELENLGTAPAHFQIDHTITPVGDAPQHAVTNRTVDGDDAITYAYGPLTNGTALLLEVDSLDDPTEDLSLDTRVDCAVEETPTTLEATSTTEVSSPTTAVGAPTTGTPTVDVLADAEAVGGASLPRTGSGTAVLGGVGVVTLGAGLALVAAARRRRAEVVR